MNIQLNNILDFLHTRPVNKKIIIGIEGYSGTGKSTLLKELSHYISFVPVHRDDFLTDREVFKTQFEVATKKEKILEYFSVNHQDILQLTEAFRSGHHTHTCIVRGDESTGSTSGKADQRITFDLTPNIMIIEGVWLYHPKLFNHIFDYKIYLDTDQEAADERRRQREMKKWGELYYPDTKPDNYFRLVKIAYNDYLEKYLIKDNVDLVCTV